MDNQPGPVTRPCEPGDALLKIGSTSGVGPAQISASPWVRRPSPVSFRIAPSWCGRSEPAGRLRPDGSRHAVRAAPPTAGPFRRRASAPTRDRSIRLSARVRGFREPDRSGPPSLFLNETFAGNGRTCGTCHVETNNFTVDPELHRHPAAKRSAVRGRDQPPADDAGELGPAPPFRADPRQRGRIRPVCRRAWFAMRATQNVQALANSSVAQDRRAPSTSAVNGRKSESTRAPGLGERRAAAPRFPARRHCATRPGDDAPYSGCGFPRPDR